MHRAGRAATRRRRNRAPRPASRSADAFHLAAVQEAGRVRPRPESYTTRCRTEQVSGRAREQQRCSWPQQFTCRQQQTNQAQNARKARRRKRLANADAFCGERTETRKQKPEATPTCASRPLHRPHRPPDAAIAILRHLVIAVVEQIPGGTCRTGAPPPRPRPARDLPDAISPPRTIAARCDRRRRTCRPQSRGDPHNARTLQ